MCKSARVTWCLGTRNHETFTDTMISRKFNIMVYIYITNASSLKPLMISLWCSQLELGHGGNFILQLLLRLVFALARLPLSVHEILNSILLWSPSCARRYLSNHFDWISSPTCFKSLGPLLLSVLSQPKR